MKKEVIQGIRGWGVFLLLLFHHYTKPFPNGYIGADIIIVISGFVAAYALRQERVMNSSSIKDFIVLKAKQMLPLYYFATFLILLTAYILLPISYQQTNLERSKTAMLLISNIKLSCIENNLSIMLPSIEDAFGHMWLPCLLVQWYLVAPYLFWIQRRVTENDKTFFAVLAACSMGLFLFSKKIVSAYWLHCRLWQFCAGALAALYLPKEHESGADGDTGTSSETYIVLGDNGGNRSEKQETLSFQTNCMQYGRSFLRHPVFLLPLLIPFLWLRFPTFDLRLYITVATTLLLYAGHRNEIFPFVTNSVSVSLGSIFYPLYLAHWPVCSFTKYHTDIVSNAVEYGIAVSIGIAYVTSTQLSKVYSRMSSTVVKVVYLLMIVISVGLSMKAVEFQGDELHYTTISLIDAFYDIMNSIY